MLETCDHHIKSFVAITMYVIADTAWQFPARDRIYVQLSRIDIAT